MKKFKSFDEIINSVDGAKRAEASPYLYTNLKGRLSKELSNWEKIAELISRPAIAFLIMIIVVFINVYAYSNYADERTAGNDYTAAIYPEPENILP